MPHFPKPARSSLCVQVLNSGEVCQCLKKGLQKLVSIRFNYGHHFVSKPQFLNLRLMPHLVVVGLIYHQCSNG